MASPRSQFLSKQDEEDSNALNMAAMTPRRLRKPTLPSTVEKLQEELRNVLADLEEKQRHATLAAQYGSALLQTNDKLRAELEEMNTKLEAAYENMNELHQNLAEQNTQNVQLRTSNSVLHNQVQNAQKENQILLAEFQEAKELLDEAQRKNRSIHTLTERKHELERELEKYYGLQDKVEELSQRETFLTNKHKKLLQNYKQQSSELAEYREQVVDLSKQIEEQKVDGSKIQTLANQLQQSQRALEELKEEKRVLEEMPILSQFSETSTLRALLQENRALLENLDFSDLESESKAIVDSLINDIPSEDNKEVGAKSDGKPTNAFYLLTAILTKRKCEDLEKRLKQDSAELQALREEIKEFHSEKKTFEQNIERADRRRDKLEEKLNAMRSEHDKNLEELEELCEKQKAEIAKLQDLASNQSKSLSITQMQNEEKLKRRIEELASLEVEYSALQGKNSQAYEELKATKASLTEAQNRNSEFQEVIRRLNVEKGDLQQQASISQREVIALQKTKESQQEMLETLRNQHREQLNLIGILQGDLENLQEVYTVSEEQIELGKEEIDLLQNQNDILQSQIQKEREKHAKQVEKYLQEIQDLNEFIQMMQAIEEEQLELEAEVANDQSSGGHSNYQRDNIELKKKLHDTHMELSLIEAEKQLLDDQISLLQEDIEFEKKQREQDLAEELKYRNVLNNQISQLQERLQRAEELRLQEITKLENLKQRTFHDLQQQLEKEQSINQSNLAKVKRLTEQNKELERANHDLVSSMAMMIKDSGEECQRIDELEEQLRRSKIRHKEDAKTIQRLQNTVQQLYSRLQLKRPYMNTLAPPNSLVIPDFPISDETEPPEHVQTPTREYILSFPPLTPEQPIEPSEELQSEEREEITESEPEIETETALLKDVENHIRDLVPSENIQTQAPISQSLMLCKLINQIVPGTIDERAITQQPKNEQEEVQNFNLCLNSAKAIGCDVPNIQAIDVATDASKLGQLTWEIVRTELLSNVSIRKHPELVQLQHDMELQAQIVDIQSLTPQELLLHWTNHHLAEAGNLSKAKITNFEEDLESLEVHHALLTRLCTQRNIPMNHIPTWNIAAPYEERAVIITQLAEALNCNKFLFPKEIQSKNAQLNVAFLANLFHNHSELSPSSVAVMVPNNHTDLPEEDHGTREERAFRMWINSLGIGTYVHNLQTDVRDGLILLHVFDKISPGIVQWSRVNKDPKRLGMYRKVENCTLCIKYGRDLGFSLVGIGGKDIFDGNRKFILALVWQMMQLHLLSILRQVSSDNTKKINEKDVVGWANTKLRTLPEAEYSVDSFKSEKLKNSFYLAKLIDCVSPGAINFDFISTSDDISLKELEENAKYVISIARKIGCCIFLVWEDIVEQNHKMIFTLVATLMLKDSQSKMNK